MTLFTPDQLQDWLQYPVETTSAAIAEKVVTGWLSDATGYTTWPEGPDLPPQVFSWSLELGGIAYENPTSQTDDQAQQVRTTWSDRRSQILASARRWALSPAGPSRAATAPSGAYEQALGWPDGAIAPSRYPRPGSAAARQPCPTAQQVQTPWPPA